MFSWPNFLWMEPPDSSAARMPLWETRRLAAISSRSFDGVGLAMIS